MLAPMRRPVNEPGPDMKVISVMSVKDFSISVSFSRMKDSNFSARSLAKV